MHLRLRGALRVQLDLLTCVYEVLYVYSLTYFPALVRCFRDWRMHCACGAFNVVMIGVSSSFDDLMAWSHNSSALGMIASHPPAFAPE